ncbi:DUF4178 domain-containing protein [Chryseobacterium oryctis]|uniref:DUF4178 domain-containing protein n=1 Tax=Chryseobacterium oryctis TaxID=2952618 RepID=A0ABT3HQI0_9FLAO|nr:DUF4178 domain-containing protein [Chryseobacterium oryctis]MCW3162047.1 DUF4178 domain-containing protein [Chryseobacterium oryctis]
MHHICPACNSENKLDLTFDIEEYVCKSCSRLIDVEKNKQTKHLKVPTENVVLDVGQKGVVDGVEYTVIGIVIRKYGTSIFWREYYLKNNKGEDAFLSESDGHWVLLNSINKSDVKRKSWNTIYVEFNSVNYRRYETTQCSIHAAKGFFEDKLDFGVATYKEYVNGTQMISEEKSKNNVQYFFGKHISKYKIKRAFKLSGLPGYSGIGIVQPYYFNITQTINIFSIVALLICVFQLYVYTSRTNLTVFEQEINFEDVKNKELVSNSFTLSGGSAPLKIYAFSGVDNSWANIQLSLVNESTNEVVYASKDIEQYHGYEDGESWSEGSTTEEFNLCGVSSGKYHFVISAEKEGVYIPLTNLQAPDAKVSISRDNAGLVNVIDNSTGQLTTFMDGKTLEKDSSVLGNLVRESFGTSKIDSLINTEANNLSSSPDSYNKYVKIKATWLPVSFWNFGIILFLMVVTFIAIYAGRYYFNVNKWKNSSNSPYSVS